MLSGYPSVDTNLSASMREKAYTFAAWLRMQPKAVKSAEIEREFGISGVQVRSMVNYLRGLGDPMYSRIASSEDGYRWAHTYEDIIETRKHLRERCSSMQKLVDGLALAFGRDPRQAELL